MMTRQDDDATTMKLGSLSSSSSPSDFTSTVSGSPPSTSQSPSPVAEAVVSGRTSPPNPPSDRSDSAMTRDLDALFCGGGISFLTGKSKVRFSYGYSAFKGERSTVEDYFDAKVSDVYDQMVAFFGVYDDKNKISNK